MKTNGKIKDNLAGEERLKEAAEELREMAKVVHQGLSPTSKIEMLNADMQSMAKEIRANMARSKVAMLASVDILLAGEDLLCVDLLEHLQSDRNQFVNEPESPDEKERKNLLDEITTILSGHSAAMLEKMLDVLRGVKRDTIRISA